MPGETRAPQRIKEHEFASASIVITPAIRTSSQPGLADRDGILQAEDALHAMRCLGCGP